MIGGVNDDFIPPATHAEQICQAMDDSNRYKNLILVPGDHNDERPMIALDAIYSFLQQHVGMFGIDVIKPNVYFLKIDHLHQVIAMWKKNIFAIGSLLALLFITLGDRVLPEPYNTMSYSTRTQIHQFFVGLLPDSTLNKGYDNKRSDELIEQMENNNRDRREN